MAVIQQREFVDSATRHL